MAAIGPDKRKIGTVCAALAAAVALAGCETPASDTPLMTAESQVKLRSIQSRAFDTTAKRKTLRTVMATLQDLSFVIDDADAEVGTISGTKFGKTEMGMHYALRMTVSVRPRGEKQLLVRANALYGKQAVTEPDPYQDFFAALQKAMFLDAHLIAPSPDTGAADGGAAKATAVAAAAAEPQVALAPYAAPAAAATPAAVEPQDQDGPLSSDQITRLLSGVEIQQGSYEILLKSNGGADISNVGGAGFGKWWIANNKHCVKWTTWNDYYYGGSTPPEGCFMVVKTGIRYEFVDTGRSRNRRQFAVIRRIQ